VPGGLDQLNGRRHAPHGRGGIRASSNAARHPLPVVVDVLGRAHLRPAASSAASGASRGPRGPRPVRPAAGKRVDHVPRLLRSPRSAFSGRGSSAWSQPAPPTAAPTAGRGSPRSSPLSCRPPLGPNAPARSAARARICPTRRVATPGRPRMRDSRPGSTRLPWVSGVRFIARSNHRSPVGRVGRRAIASAQGNRPSDSSPATGPSSPSEHGPTRVEVGDRGGRGSRKHVPPTTRRSRPVPRSRASSSVRLSAVMSDTVASNRVEVPEATTVREPERTSPGRASRPDPPGRTSGPVQSVPPASR